MAPRSVVLAMHMGLGDAVCFTRVVDTLRRQHPQLRLLVKTNFPGFFPAELRYGEQPYDEFHCIDYDRTATYDVHLIQALADNACRKLGIPRVVVDELTGTLPDPGPRVLEDDTPYWVIFAGCKSGPGSIAVKHWPHHHYQQVVDALRREVLFVQCGANHGDHLPLNGCLNYVAELTVPRLMRMIRHASGVVSPVTGPMHLAAAYGVPTVVIGGAYEDPVLTRYPNQRQLTNVGSLWCCRVPCWAGSFTGFGKRCVQIETDPAEEKVARCMLDVSVADVVAAVRSFTR